MEGFGPSQIAKKLKEAKVDCPTVHWMKMGRNAPAKTPDNPYDWAPRTISGILEKQEYLGHMVNFKTRKQSYKSKKKIENPPEAWKIFERIPTKPLLMQTLLNECRSCVKTNAVLQEPERAICSPVSSAALTAKRSCTTAPARTLKQGKITLSAPLPERRGQMSATLTSFVRWCWRKVSCST